MGATNDKPSDWVNNLVTAFPKSADAQVLNQIGYGDDADWVDLRRFFENPRQSVSAVQSANLFINYFKSLFGLWKSPDNLVNIVAWKGRGVYYGATGKKR